MSEHRHLQLMRRTLDAFRSVSIPSIAGTHSGPDGEGVSDVDYDRIASDYDRRYESDRYDGVLACLGRFLEGAERGVAEVGCGTGHWLREVASIGRARPVGLDPSWGMLRRARGNAADAGLVRGTAEHLPWAAASLDRVFCVNALHHFPAPTAFFTECRRVLRPGGGLLLIGLDPHRGDDVWWVYDYFPSALSADRTRYPSTATMGEWLATAGFRAIGTEVAEHIRADVPFEAARAQGFLDRGATSQLMVIRDDEFETGMSRVCATRPVLRTDLRLLATVGWL